MASPPETVPEPEYHRRYGPRTAASEVVKDLDLSDKVIFITGTTHGIGVETAKALALKGAHLVLANRSITQAEAVRDEIYKETEHRKIDLIHMDLSSLQSVEAGAKEFLSKKLPLNVLILNAGVFGPNEKTTIDGHNTSFGVNHLAHFYLSHLLKDKLVESAPSRVVVVSSDSHRNTFIKPVLSVEEKVNLLMVPPDTTSVAMLQYARSKMCNVLFAKKLHRELSDKDVHVYVLHPGSLIGTSIARNYGAVGKVLNALTKPFTKTVEQGAATSVFCAVHPDVERDSGRYYESCWDEEKNLARALADDEAVQDLLWSKSLELVDRYEQSR